jgi:hypothetical protein
MSDETGFLTTWGREFTEALRPASSDVSGHDAYEVLFRALGRDPTLADFLGLTEADIARLHIAAQEVLELDSIDLQLIKDAVEATQLHWSDQN